jgi:uncharacterized protein HemY
LALELAVLRAAQAAIERGDPAQAVERLDHFAAQYALGTLRQERLATRVRALCALGRVPEAAITLEQLARIAPRSPHLLRLRTSCASQVLR